MDYFGGVTQEERWKNELLNEIRTMNQLLTKVLGNNAQVSETKVVTPQILNQAGRKKVGAR